MTSIHTLKGSTSTEALVVNGAGESHTPINGGRGPLDIWVMDADGERVLSAPDEEGYWRMFDQIFW